MVFVDSKFSAPAFDPDFHLSRNLQTLGFLTPEATFPHVVFIEGRAGQGKSTLGAQLIQQWPGRYCWYRMEVADRSGAYFLASLLAGLKTVSPGFNTPAEASIQSGHIDSLQQPQMLKTMLADFERNTPGNYVLVFDDVHLCLNSGTPSPLLQTLLEHPSPHLHLILLGRHDLAPLVATTRQSKTVSYLNNRELAFSANEIAALYNGLWQLPLTRPAVQALKKITDGWAMGLQLAAHSLRDQSPDRIEQQILSLQLDPQLNTDHIFSQLLNELPAAQRTALLNLSLLEDIPLELAEQMTGKATIYATLTELSQRHGFVRPLENDRNTFVLHHLLQAHLRQRLHREYPAAEIDRLYTLAASWYRNSEEPDWGIRYFIAAGNYSEAESVLRQAGLKYQVHHRLAALHQEFGDLSAETLSEHPWFAYYRALGLMSVNPPQALPLLQAALQKFASGDDCLGELLAGTQLLLFGISADGNYARGYPLLTRTMDLLGELSDTLPPQILSHVANIMLLANTFLRFDPQQAELFFDLGLDLAQREVLVELETEARVARLYYLIFSGSWDACLQELEKALPLMHNPLCSQHYRGAIFLAYLSFLKGCGDFDAYERHKNMYRKNFPQSLRENSISDDYVLLWDLHMQLALGNREQCRTLLQTAQTSRGSAAQPHLKNLFLQYAALLAAEAGEREDALAIMDSARQLRQVAGGEYFHDLNHAFYGATYATLGDDEQALACFEQALRSASTHLRETALAFRAHLHLRRKRTAAEQDLRTLLESMRQAKHGHFYGWMPEVMKEVLAAAVGHNIEVAQAQKLAEERLDATILPDGTILPLLHIRTLGNLQFCLSKRPVLNESDFSESQRQMLAILLSRPDCSYSQKHLQLLLWPNSPERKSRNNFDKLLSRLRHSLHAALGIHAGHYLQLKNGILALRHCQVDAHQFGHWADQGLKQYKKGQLWLAENLLHRATDCYLGEFLPSIGHIDLIEQQRTTLLTTYQQSALIQAEILHKLQNPEQAIELLETSLRHNPLQDATVRALYALLIAQVNPSRAQAVVDNYTQLLQKENFTPNEVRETLERLWG